ncbi:MAG: hypothetical protein ACP5H2_11195 [Solirubrobacteraceae bacterium]
MRPRKRDTRLARAWITSGRQSTTIAADGAVRSVQTASIELPREMLDRFWAPAQLENLGRTYWHFLTRFSLGLIRVLYSAQTRSVVLVSPRMPLLRFQAPKYSLDVTSGSISWGILDGLLVSRRGHNSGYLALHVRRLDDNGSSLSHLNIDVEVANFYPAIASGLGRSVYRATQLFIHVILTHAFLRSLASLELQRSSVRRFPER